VTRSVSGTPDPSLRPASVVISVWMPAMPLTCWSASACRLPSVWLSPPNDRRIDTTGVTFAAISAPAARACPATSSLLMALSVSASASASWRTCV
jgi:hypothetical protein